jgi:large subunit ribosomal protein L10
LPEVSTKAKTLFFLKGGKSLALSKDRKKEVVGQYVTWLKDSEAVVLAEYTGLTMNQFDQLRAKIRDAGGEFHVIKNTLAKLAFESAGLDAPEEFFQGSSAMGIAFEDPPGVAKALKDYGKDHEFVKIKGGFMDGAVVTAEQMHILAELPPLPVVRGQLLGVISAPASKLVRTLAEPARSLAQVLKAHADAAAAA